MRFAVIGAGSWGTAIAQLLATGGHEVALWARRAEAAELIERTRVNERYLPGVALDGAVHATSDLAAALLDVDGCAIVVPSAYLAETSRQLAPHLGADVPVVVCSKGFDAQSGRMPVETVAHALGREGGLAVLSGPNHAEEVSRGLPSATVIASASDECARFFQQAFATDAFRTYASSDVVGVEVCAACKNVVAIAVGLSYGSGFGDNTASLLMTRGLAEMSRLVAALGGKAITCLGLAGTGDLIATCTSQHSRNRRFGELLARGGTLEQFQAETHMVVEGALACKTLAPVAARAGVEMPIADVVRAVVWDGMSVREAADALISRPLKEEF